MKLFFCLLVILINLEIANSRDDLTYDEKKKVNKVLKLTTNFNKAERSEALSGGAGTVNKIGKNSFSHHFTTLTFEELIYLLKLL